MHEVVNGFMSMDTWHGAFQGLARRSQQAKVTEANNSITVNQGNGGDGGKSCMKGGRGKKAPYEQKHMRIPLPLVADVSKMVEEFRGQAFPVGSDSPSSLPAPTTTPNREELIDLAHRMLARKKSARATLQAFLSEMLGEEIHLVDRP